MVGIVERERRRLIDRDRASFRGWVGRVAGVALLSLGLVCWISRQVANKTAVLAGMLTYNLLVTAYLTYLGFGGELVGILLWPATVIHAALTLLFVYVGFNHQRSKAATP